MVRVIKLVWIFFLPCLLQAKVIETPRIEEVVSQIPDKAFVVVDLDHTLFQTKQAYGHELWRQAEIDKYLEKGLPYKEVVEQVNSVWLEAQKKCTAEPLEPNFVLHLQALQQKGTAVIGCTNRIPNAAECTLRQVRQLGFDFMQTAPGKEIFTLPMDHTPLYMAGILFGGYHHAIGDVIYSFLKQLDQIPAKVVMIDDKRSNLEQLEALLTPLGIEFLGIHYTAIDHVLSNYNPKAVGVQMELNQRLLTNSEALKFIEN